MCSIETGPTRINSSTLTLTFKVQSKVRIEHFRQFYPGLQWLGKNFLVSTVPTADQPTISRQYSICFAINPIVSQQIVSCLDKNSAATLDYSLFDNRSKDNVQFTVKNYKTQNGLS